MATADYCKALRENSPLSKAGDFSDQIGTTLGALGAIAEGLGQPQLGKALGSAGQFYSAGGQVAQNGIDLQSALIGAGIFFVGFAAGAGLFFPLGVEMAIALGASAEAGAIGALMESVAGYAFGNMVGKNIQNTICDPYWGGKFKDDLAKKFNNVYISPLVLDTNGDGKINLISVNHSTAFFDMDADGFAEHTGWVGPEDGLLVYDANGDGTISTINELFGENGFGFEAFDKLASAEFNSNGDNVFDARDARFTQVKVWIDADQNGLSQRSELKSLASLNIKSINLNDTYADAKDPSGNKILSTSTFMKTDGTTKPIADVFFEVNQTVSQYMADKNFVINPKVFALPQIIGSGDVMDLWKAMSFNASLLTSVQTLVNQDFTKFNLTKFIGQVEKMALKWLNVENINILKYGSSYNAQHVDGLTHITGDYSLNLGEAQSRNYEDLWDSWVNQLSLKLLIQIPKLAEANAAYTGLTKIKAYYDKNSSLPEMTQAQVNTMLNPIFADAHKKDIAHPLYGKFNGMAYNFVTDNIDGDPIGYIQKAFNAAPTTASKLPAYWSNYIPIFKALAQSKGMMTTFSGLNASEVIAGTAGADTINGGENKTPGSANDDFIYAGAGNDVIYNNLGNDFIYGGAGNDTIHGSGKGTLIFWGIGDGKDTIAFDNNDFGISEYEKILLREGITPDNIMISRSGNNVVMQVRGTSDSITFIDGMNYRIGQIAFTNGQIFDMLKIYAALLTGTAGDDFIKGFDESDSMSGSDGNDTIWGMGGNDTLNGGNGDDSLSIQETDVSGLYGVSVLYGGSGNDTLQGVDSEDSLYGGNGNDILLGGRGNDVYYYNIGEGVDTIQDSGEADQIIFGPGITVSNLTFKALETDFVIVLNTGNKLYLTNQLDSLDGNDIENFVFQDKMLSWPELFQLYLTKLPTTGSDLIRGLQFTETLAGGNGSDYLLGTYSADTYVLNAAQGNDVIYDKSTSTTIVDTVAFGIGISKKNIAVSKVNNSLIVNLPGFTNLIVNDHFTPYHKIENFTFSDGSSLTAANIDSLIAAHTNDNLIKGSGVAETLSGGIGDDTLQGGFGNDTYLYNKGDGNELIRESGGAVDVADKLQFGGDFVSSNLVMTRNYLTPEDLILSFANQTGTVTLQDQFYAANSYAIETIVFGNGEIWNASMLQSKFLESHVSTLNDVVYGFYTNDIISSSTGDDGIFGLAGNDSLNGESGMDTIDGGKGNDTINGGIDDDVIYGGLDSDSLMGFDGNDRLYGDSSSDSLYGQAGDDVLDGGSYADYLNGGTGNDTLLGGDDNDTMYGATDNDSMDGGFGNDLLYGGTGNDEQVGNYGDDTLYGEDGNDIIVGGNGKDLLIGGNGADTFVFYNSSFTNPDRIMDFAKGIDTIEYDAFGDIGIVAGSPKEHLLGYIYDAAHNLTIITNFSQDFKLELVGNIPLTKSDFYFPSELLGEPL